MTHPYLAGVLDETRAFVRRHVIFSATHADTVALWNAHTYAYDCGQHQNQLIHVARAPSPAHFEVEGSEGWEPGEIPVVPAFVV